MSWNLKKNFEWAPWKKQSMLPCLSEIHIADVHYLSCSDKKVCSICWGRRCQWMVLGTWSRLLLVVLYILEFLLWLTPLVLFRPIAILKKILKVFFKVLTIYSFFKYSFVPMVFLKSYFPPWVLSKRFKLVRTIEWEKCIKHLLCYFFYVMSMLFLFVSLSLSWKDMNKIL